MLFQRVLAALVCTVTLVVTGCGGGSGGVNADLIYASLSDNSVEVASTFSGYAPSKTVRVTVDHFPSGGLYIQGSYTTRGVDSVSSFVSGNAEFLSLTFRAPSGLGVGVYSDTLTLQICRDQQCTQQIANSPLRIPVTYTVTGGSSSATGASSLATLVPTTVSIGHSDFTLTVTGTGFDTGAQVYWNGSHRPTAFVSATQLTAQITASDVATPGTFPVTVLTAGNPMLPSNALPVAVTNTALSVTQLSPTSVAVGNPVFTQTVMGTGFDSFSTVQWNGSARPTTFVSTTELLAQISAADVAGAATANVTVNRVGTGASNAKQVAIVAPSIDATAYQINPQHSGVINFANIVAPSAFPLSSKWTATLNGSPSYALIAGGRVFAMAYIASTGNYELSAFRADTGARIWGPIPFFPTANATYDNGRVFVMASDFTQMGSPAIVSAYDAASGVQVWNTTLPSTFISLAPPTAAHGMVFVDSTNGVGRTVRALDQATGAVVWTKQTVPSGEYSGPTVTADGVYLTLPCETYAFRPLTGELIWNSSTGCTGFDVSTSVVANGVIYSPNANTGSGYDGMTYDAQTGTFIASYTASASPVVGTQMAYVLRNGTLQATRLSDGNAQWSFAGDGGLDTAPILVNNYLFIFSNTGNFYALDASTGSQLWQTNLGGSMRRNRSFSYTGLSGLSAGGGLLVVPVGNTLVAYTLSNNP